jgi:small subunit ribosomal protein S14
MSIGRQSALHAESCRFESDRLQYKNKLMKARLERENKRRLLTVKYEKKRAALKQVYMDKTLSVEARLIIQGMLEKLPRDSSKTRLHNRCLLTGRPRSVYRYFGLSRIKMRELALAGKLPGVLKASW